DGCAIFSSAQRHLFLSHAELPRKPVKRPCLLHGIQIGALQILDDGDLHRLLIRHLPQNRGNRFLPRHGGGPPAPLAGNQLETAICLRPHQDRLDHAVRGNRSRKLGKRILIDPRPRLIGIGIDLFEQDLERLATSLPLIGYSGYRRSSGGRMYPWQQRIKSLAQGASFWVGSRSCHRKGASYPAVLAGGFWSGDSEPVGHEYGQKRTSTLGALAAATLRSTLRGLSILLRARNSPVSSKYASVPRDRAS